MRSGKSSHSSKSFVRMRETASLPEGFLRRLCGLGFHALLDLFAGRTTLRHHPGGKHIWQKGCESCACWETLVCRIPLEGGQNRDPKTLTVSWL